MSPCAVRCAETLGRGVWITADELCHQWHAVVSQWLRALLLAGGLVSGTASQLVSPARFVRDYGFLLSPVRVHSSVTSSSVLVKMQTFLKGRRVGYWLSEKKMKKLNFQAFADLCRYASDMSDPPGYWLLFDSFLCNSLSIHWITACTLFWWRIYSYSSYYSSYTYYPSGLFIYMVYIWHRIYFPPLTWVQYNIKFEYSNQRILQ